MKKTLLLLLLAASALVASADEKGFVSIFNGKDLEGWDGKPGSWEVRDGEIWCTGATKEKNWLIWRGGEPADFILRLEFRWDNGNSGVQVRSDDLGDRMINGYQVEVAQADVMGLWHHSLQPKEDPKKKARHLMTTAGEKAVINEAGERKNEKFVEDPAEVQAKYKEHEWNSMEIVAKGNTLVQKINGVHFATLVDNDSEHSRRKGFIAFQDHGKGCIVAFRNVRLKTLDADESAAAPEDGGFFLIGNSLTWDTVPSKLSGDVQWHVDCGKPLPYIRENPGKPCVKTSTLWPEALEKKQYSRISLQPHYRSTLEEDVETISFIADLQPEARIIIHTGWARAADREKEFASTEPGGTMTHSLAWFDALLAELREARPGRDFRRTRAMDLLQQVAADIESGKTPFKDIEELYRDAIHMNTVTGRYLMHNAMRHAMGQPRSVKGFAKIDPAHRKYFDSVLDTLGPLD